MVTKPSELEEFAVMQIARMIFDSKDKAMSRKVFAARLTEEELSIVDEAVKTVSSERAYAAMKDNLKKDHEESDALALHAAIETAAELMSKCCNQKRFTVGRGDSLGYELGKVETQFGTVMVRVKE